MAGRLAAGALAWQRRRRHSLLRSTAVLALLALLVCSLPRLGASQQQQQQQQAGGAVIVELTDEGVSYGASMSLVSAAAAQASAAAAEVQAAGVAAAAAAADGGAGPQKVAAVSAAAAAAAGAMPALLGAGAALSSDAAAAGVAVVGVAPLATAFQGLVLRTSSADDAAKLKAQLESNGRLVKNVWLAGARQLVQPLRRGDGAAMAAKLAAKAASSSSGVAAAAAGTAAGVTATTGSSASTGLERLWSEQRNVTGRGALLCVVDTGINYRLPLFGSCTGINAPKGRCRVVVGHDFVGDAYTARLNGPPRVQGQQPIDCFSTEGHGTMVASVMATDNGVAPGALLGAYRVFGCAGSSMDDVIVEALDRAIRDGCDVINLSLASGSGYPDTGVYKAVMARARQLGVVVVKAAGNSGDEGPFTADVSTATGALAIGSVGSDWGYYLDEYMTVSSFSSYGPNPLLELGPHVCAPGAYVPMMARNGEMQYDIFGTSFSSPYAAGVLALWLEAKAADAAARGTTLSTAAAGQAAAARAIVATAGRVPAEFGPDFVEPVARCGAGVLQADAMLLNQVVLDPPMLVLPSRLRQPHTATFTATWEGPPHPDGTVTFNLVHDKALSMTLQDGWYGTEAVMEKRYVGADVTFSTPTVKFVTGPPAPGSSSSGDNTTSSGRRLLATTLSVQVQVTFTLPPELAREGLLYSGRIRLEPRQSSARRLVPVVVPYQGFSGDYRALRLLARPLPSVDSELASLLNSTENSLCYAPGSQPVFPNALLDKAPVKDICRTLAGTPNTTVAVSLKALRDAPRCSLRAVLVPQVPVQRITVQVIDAATSKVLGSLAPLDTAADACLADSGKVQTYCLNFNGTFAASGSNRATQLVRGRQYRLRATLRGPVAAADAARGINPRNLAVDLRGRIRVTL